MLTKTPVSHLKRPCVHLVLMCIPFTALYFRQITVISAFRCVSVDISHRYFASCNIAVLQLLLLDHCYTNNYYSHHSLSHSLTRPIMSTLKIIVVTGGNKGIGKALCEKLLSGYSETFVYLCSRDVTRGNAAVASIVENLGGAEAVAKRIECLEMVSMSVALQDQ
jgi:hypothetical protein